MTQPTPPSAARRKARRKVASLAFCARGGSNARTLLDERFSDSDSERDSDSDSDSGRRRDGV